MVVGYNIRVWRAKRRITQAELASRAKMAQSTLSEIENGKITGYSEDTLKRIADVLQIEVIELWREPA